MWVWTTGGMSGGEGSQGISLGGSCCLVAVTQFWGLREADCGCCMSSLRLETIVGGSSFLTASRIGDGDDDDALMFLHVPTRGDWPGITL